MRPADITRTETPERRRDDLPRQARRPAHLRQHRPVGGLRRRLRAGRGPAVPDGRAAPLRRGHARVVPRRRRCDFEQMDHDQLLLAPYTKARAIAQVDALPTEYGAQGALAKSMIDNYVDGVNAYIAAAKTNPMLLPADYAAARRRRPPTGACNDVVAIAGLIGGIFGKGGGSEIANAHLLQYLQQQARLQGRRDRVRAVPHEQRPARADDVADKSFPYEIPGTIDPSTPAHCPTTASAVTGGPTDTDPNCKPRRPTRPRCRSSTGSNAMPKHMSNALRRERQPHRARTTRSPSSGRRCPTSRRRSCRWRTCTRRTTRPRVRRSPAPASSNSAAARTTPGRRPRPAATSSTSVSRRSASPVAASPAAHGTYYLFKGKCRR